MIWGVTWVDALQAIAIVVGFVFIGYQIHHLRQSMLAGAHDRLEAHYVSILRIFLEKPHLHRYFYGSAVYDRLSDPEGNLRAEVDTASEAILGLLEHAWLQRANLTDESWETCWLPYARERLRKSHELRKFLRENRSWYTSGIRDLLTPHEPEHEPKR